MKQLNPFAYFKQDLLSGFFVFLIALPLCLGISLASGFPPIAGIITAIVGGVVAPFISNSELTIKGPAAGLIAIVIGSVMALGNGDMERGYHLTLGILVVSGIVQILFGLLKVGFLVDFFPLSAVHGLLASIGIIIFSKQVHVMFGVSPESKDPIGLIAEIPHTIAHLNPEIALIGVLTLALLYAWPKFGGKIAKFIPAQILALGVAVPLGIKFGLDNEHSYTLFDRSYKLGPKYLVTVPSQFLSHLQSPDYSAVLTSTGFKFVLLFCLIGTIESLLSVKAIDLIDPKKRKTDLNRDLLATGIGNTIAALAGGLPMISEIVRSSNNVSNGAQSRWANFYHGILLLLCVSLIPEVLHKIPLSSLGAMLVFTGLRLANPKEALHLLRIGREQLLIFITTVYVTLRTDLLIGICSGIVVKWIFQWMNGVDFSEFFTMKFSTEADGDKLVVDVTSPMIFSNWFRLAKVIEKSKAKKISIQISKSKYVDHSVMQRLFQIGKALSNQGRELKLVGLESLSPITNHPEASRRKNI